jgi:hypothetical protein
MKSVIVSYLILIMVLTFAFAALLGIDILKNKNIISQAEAT